MRYVPRMPGELRRALAANMRRERLRLGFSQDELAACCNLHRTYIGGIERAERNITLSTLEKVAGALGVSPLGLLKEGVGGEEGEQHGRNKARSSHQS